MNTTFAELVEEVRNRTPDEQEQLIELLSRARVEARRHEISATHTESRELEGSGRLRFSSDSKALLAQLNGA